MRGQELRKKIERKTKERGEAERAPSLSSPVGMDPPATSRPSLLSRNEDEAAETREKYEDGRVELGVLSCIIRILRTDMR